MKKIVFYEGPPKLSIRNVGIFDIGVPQEVDDSIAVSLIMKGHFKYYNEYKEEEVVEEEVKVEEVKKRKYSKKT